MKQNRIFHIGAMSLLIAAAHSVGQPPPGPKPMDPWMQRAEVEALVRYQEEVLPSARWNVAAGILCTDYRSRFWLAYLARSSGSTSNSATLLVACLTNAAHGPIHGYVSNTQSIATYHLASDRYTNIVESLLNLAYEARYPKHAADPVLDGKIWLVRVSDSRGPSHFLWYDVPLDHPSAEAVLRELDEVSGSQHRVFREP